MGFGFLFFLFLASALCFAGLWLEGQGTVTPALPALTGEIEEIGGAFDPGGECRAGSVLRLVVGGVVRRGFPSPTPPSLAKARRSRPRPL